MMRHRAVAKLVANLITTLIANLIATFIAALIIAIIAYTIIVAASRRLLLKPGHLHHAGTP